MIYRRMQKMRILREKSLRNLPKPENNSKKNEPSIFNYALNSFLLASTSFGIYKFLNKSDLKIENTSISDVKDKTETFEKITIVNDKTAIIKKKMKNEYYKINIPNIDYFEKKQVQLRPVWYLNHKQKPFKLFESYKIKNATKLLKNSLCIPSSSNLSLKEIKRISGIFNQIL